MDTCGPMPVGTQTVYLPWRLSGGAVAVRQVLGTEPGPGPLGLLKEAPLCQGLGLRGSGAEGPGHSCHL